MSEEKAILLNVPFEEKPEKEETLCYFVLGGNKDTFPTGATVKRSLHKLVRRWYLHPSVPKDEDILIDRLEVLLIPEEEIVNIEHEQVYQLSIAQNITNLIFRNKKTIG